MAGDDGRGAVVVDPSRLWVRRGAPPPMDHAHRHDDVEFNLVVSGHLDYLFWGEPLRLEAGDLALFWGVAPHRLLPQRADDGAPTEALWAHLPLPVVLGWGLPADQLARLLDPRPVVVPTSVIARDAVALMTSWVRDIGTVGFPRDLPGDGDTGTPPAAAVEIVELEAQALLRRALAAAPAAPSTRSRPDGGLAHRTHGIAMAGYVTEHFREPLRAADVAAAVHLSPTHAMTVFKDAMGVTLGAYVVRCRVAEAQRLLVATASPVGEIALEVGFSSLSSFYEQFARVTGSPPAAYRRRAQAGA